MPMRKGIAYDGRRPRWYKKTPTTFAESIKKWLTWRVSRIQPVNLAFMRRSSDCTAVRCTPG